MDKLHILCDFTVAQDIKGGIMVKPITVAREDFAEKLADTINESGLPAFVIIETLERTISHLKVIAQQQYEKDKAAWEAEEEKAE